MLFQPIYIGYEKLMEGNSYIGELSGQAEAKESMLRSCVGIPVKKLRSNYGQRGGEFRRTRSVSRGRAAARARAGLGRASRSATRTSPNGWPTPSTRWPTRIQVSVNRAADVNPINLLAVALLATPKHAMGEGGPARD